MFTTIIPILCNINPCMLFLLSIEKKIIKTKDFYADISNDVEERFDTSGYNKENAKPLPTGKIKKVIGLMKDEL